MICVYPADATDFSNNGNGVLAPLTAQVTETLNGEYELQISHPIDDEGKWQRLVEGCILRAPVPTAMTPKLSSSIIAGAVSNTSSVYKASKQKILHVGPSLIQPIIGCYRTDDEFIVLSQPSNQWYEVTAPDGKHGYIDTTGMSKVKDTTTEQAVAEVVEPRPLRDQPFRIYRVVPELNKVTAYARHISYDLMDNMIQTYKPATTDTGATVVQGISSHCLSEHPFTFYSDLDSTAEEVEFTNTNPLDAILGDEGIIAKYGGELLRDWFDVYVVQRVGVDSNVQIRQAKNLLGISYDVDLSDVATRIMPTGQDKDGKVLYLPELYIDSPLIDAYPHPRWIHMEVSEAKEVTSGDEQKTKSQCYTDMRNAAQAKFDAGCDLPAVTLNVDFINCADTEEYREYGFLQNIYLGDAVRVIAPRIGVSVSMRITQYTYDCLAKKYTQMTLGTVADTVQSNMISARQLPTGIISGSKLAIGSVGIGALQDGSVGSLQIQTAAIQSAHIDWDTLRITDISASTLQANGNLIFGNILYALDQSGNSDVYRKIADSAGKLYGTDVTVSGNITAQTASLGAAPAEVINQSFWQNVYIAKLIRGLYMDLCVGSWSGTTQNTETDIVFANTGGHVMTGVPLVFIMQSSGEPSGFQVTNRSTTGFHVKSNGVYTYGFEYVAIYFGFNTNGV